MSSENFVRDVAEGVTKGVLEWSSDKIVSFGKRFREGKLAFIQKRKLLN